jgi:hypothetical protein
VPCKSIVAIAESKFIVGKDCFGAEGHAFAREIVVVLPDEVKPAAGPGGRYAVGGSEVADGLFGVGGSRAIAHNAGCVCAQEPVRTESENQILPEIRTFPRDQPAEGPHEGVPVFRDGAVIIPRTLKPALVQVAGAKCRDHRHGRLVGKRVKRLRLGKVTGKGNGGGRNRLRGGLRLPETREVVWIHGWFCSPLAFKPATIAPKRKGLSPIQVPSWRAPDRSGRIPSWLPL